MYIYEIFKRDYNELQTLSTHTHKALMSDNNYYARSQLIRKQNQNSTLIKVSLAYMCNVKSSVQVNVNF